LRDVVGARADAQLQLAPNASLGLRISRQPLSIFGQADQAREIVRMKSNDRSDAEQCRDGGPSTTNVNFLPGAARDRIVRA
jgi:hypothetical protein